MENKIELYRSAIIKRLTEIKKLWNDKTPLSDSINYTLFNSGKLIRSVVVLLGLDNLGFDYLLGLDLACAIEMIQSYTLIHDDLPEMDNGQFRRGQKANHLVYGQNIALLAGDALLTDAFLVLANANLLDNTRVALIKLLATKIGTGGICFGQAQDVTIKQVNTWNEVAKMIENKTCALFEFSLMSIGIIASLEEEKMSKLNLLGRYFGLAFQIKDDLTDGDSKGLAYHQIYGLENAKLKIEQLTIKIAQLCKEIFGSNNQIYSYLKSFI